MHNERYGDLLKIAALTDGNCHLCHEPADLTFYGRTGTFGDETVTIDHLIPQSWGGGDRRRNLRLAHGNCNSYRGTRSVPRVRFELAGTREPPMSASDKNTLSAGAGVTVALAAGYGFGTPNEQGISEFNAVAALIAGLLAAALVRSAL